MTPASSANANEFFNSLLEVRHDLPGRIRYLVRCAETDSPGAGTVEHHRRPMVAIRARRSLGRTSGAVSLLLRAQVDYATGLALLPSARAVRPIGVIVRRHCLP